MTVALITARGGSKGLPRKNILPINGVPMIGWTIRAALSCDKIKRVFVSTEDQEIKEVSISFGAEVIDRPVEFSTDTTTSEEVIKHAIEWLELRNITNDTMVLLQPTSPLRTKVDIDEAIRIFETKNADFVVSVYEPLHTPVKAYIECENGSIKGLFSSTAPYLRRQDLPRAFQPNGAIYLFSIDEFKRGNCFPKTSAYPYIMSENNSVDVDTKEDLLIIEKRLKDF
ncbi:cytidylyltransferase domain-containing protein [Shewanella algae]|uniref:acylneuraminate cytidylyltransferase family protein n=1 Tax=Shewanella algae TaxID=38313 RepID=UPI001AAF8532|nr:acylneuraminate cytidylyltransferase family protein [Shewanella algae]MBO2590363.1 acylneuraminate cytidylyltransferase family protein [Shewanella algae]